MRELFEDTIVDELSRMKFWELRFLSHEALLESIVTPMLLSLKT